MSPAVYIQADSFKASIDPTRLNELPLAKCRRLFLLAWTRHWENEYALWQLEQGLEDALQAAKLRLTQANELARVSMTEVSPYDHTEKAKTAREYNKMLRAEITAAKAQLKKAEARYDAFVGLALKYDPDRTGGQKS